MTDTDLEFHAVAKTDDLDDEEIVAVSVGRQDIGIYKLDGEYYALSDICTHAYASMSEGDLRGDEVECPLHGGAFS